MVLSRPRFNNNHWTIGQAIWILDMASCRLVPLLVLVVVGVILWTYLTLGRNENRRPQTLNTADFTRTHYPLDQETHFTRLLKLYQQKMEAVKTLAQATPIPTPDECSEDLPPKAPCVDPNCKHTEPQSLSARLHSIVDLANSASATTLNNIMQLEEMQVKPTGKQTLFITGASSNHYLESQAMLKNFHETVLPNLKNFSLIYYDLGLTLEQRAQVQKHCKCEVRVFPFTKVEDWMRELNCFAWKPLILQANIRSADVLVWLDASFRLTMVGLKETLQDVKTQGMVLRPGGTVSMSQHIDTQMMQYFNSPACAYTQYRMTSAGLIFLHNEQFVREAVVTPWAICAVTRSCICPEHSVSHCDKNIRKNGKCHRYDQAGLSMIVTKLFGKYIESFRLNKFSYKVKRGDKYKYFDYLESQEQRVLIEG